MTVMAAPLSRFACKPLPGNGRNFMVPIPRFATWDDLNLWLAEQCRKRQADVLRGHSESIGQRLVRDLEALSVIAVQSPAGNG